LVASEGKQFEKDVQTSMKEQGIYHIRLKDVLLPPNLRLKIRLPHNPYDLLSYYKLHLFPLEFKSTKGQSLSFSESIIKQHQIEALTKAAQYDGVIAGFIFNFRKTQETFFIHIDDFNTYKHIAENGLENDYKSRVNKSSIPIGICKQIGVQILASKKKVNYRYYINQLFDELIHTYESNGNRTTSSSHKSKITGDEGE
jgi:penicillin-binding protein-related factor A (putative recombinase)